MIEPSVDPTVRLLLDPIYAITVGTVFAEPHEPIVERSVWIKAQEQNVADLGAETYFATLLDVLEKGQ